MPFTNEAIIAAAGGGKTTRIVSRALKQSDERAVLVTFTRENTDEITRMIYSNTPSIPPNIEVLSWYSFLLMEMVRPYRSFLYGRRIERLAWINGQSTKGIAATDVDRFYFASDGLIYSDKVAHFAVACNQASGGLALARLEQRFDHIYIDEVQDMAGYDLELIELLLKSNLKVTLVGDHRQGTYSTHNAIKNGKFKKAGIIARIEQWKKARLLTLIYETETHRCNQTIASFADTLFPNIPKTISRNEEVTGHDGVFLVATSDVKEYINRYQPQILRYSRATQCQGLDEQARNFGICKGRSFDRVMIFPNGKAMSWLATGNYEHIEKTRAQMYVGITRARFSVAFVLSKDSPIIHLHRYQFPALCA